MLVRPINLSLRYYVKDNVVLQALCPSSNCLYTKSKSTMLRPLKGELGYELTFTEFHFQTEVKVDFPSACIQQRR